MILQFKFKIILCKMKCKYGICRHLACNLCHIKDAQYGRNSVILTAKVCKNKGLLCVVVYKVQ